MWTKNKIIFGILGFFIFVMLFSFILYVFSTSGTSNNNSLSPTPSAAILPLSIESILPTEDTTVTYLPINQVDITFNQPMNPQTFYVEVLPYVDTYISQRPADPNTLIISPKVIWKEGITSIRILPTTTSLQGQKLGKIVEYKINIHDVTYPSNVDTHGI